MIKIRLRRTGSKKAPSYRVVVAPSKSPRDGRFIEILGHYHSRHDPPTLELKEDRAFHWLSVGAQPSDSFKRIMESQGVWERYTQFKNGETITENKEAESTSDASVKVVEEVIEETSEA